ncbi:MAG: hypothetical protein ACOC22_01105 [bacterium]
MKTNEEALKLLAEEEGYMDPMDMLEDSMSLGCVPGICMNDNCMATYNYEPDSNRGWCDECQTNSVKSCYVLAGII